MLLNHWLRWSETNLHLPPLFKVLLNNYEATSSKFKDMIKYNLESAWWGTHNFSSSWEVASILKGSFWSSSLIFLANSRTCLESLLYLKLELSYFKILWICMHWSLSIPFHFCKEFWGIHPMIYIHWLKSRASCVLLDLGTKMLHEAIGKILV